jgi:AcrR family transcriptional regulator
MIVQMKSVTERRRQVVARTREDILTAAVRAFARTGYHSVTMRDIAREAGYTAAALYTYFENKQEILAAVMKVMIDESLGVVDEPLPPGLDFRRRVELLVRRILDQAERRRDFFLLFLSMAQANQQPRPTKQQPNPIRTMRQAQARLARWFAKNGNPRDLGGHQPDDVARFFSGVTQSFMGSWVVQGTAPGQFRRRASLILDLFLNGVSGGQCKQQKSGTKA